MSKYCVKGGKSGEFEVVSVEVVEAKTRSVIAIAVVAVGLLLVVGAAVFAMVTEGAKSAQGYVGYAASFVSLIVGYYFGKSKK